MYNQKSTNIYLLGILMVSIELICFGGESVPRRDKREGSFKPSKADEQLDQLKTHFKKWYETVVSQANVRKQVKLVENSLVGFTSDKSKEQLYERFIQQEINNVDDIFGTTATTDNQEVKEIKRTYEALRENLLNDDRWTRDEFLVPRTDDDIGDSAPEREIRKDLIEKLLEKYIVSPCRHYVNEFDTPVFESVRLDEAIQFAMSNRKIPFDPVSAKEDEDFDHTWARFKICKKLIERNSFSLAKLTEKMKKL